MASNVKIVWDDAAIKLESASPRGPAARGMRMLADQTVLEMKKRCPVAPHDRPPSRRWPGRQSGTLRSSIRAIRKPDGDYLIGPTDQVGPGQYLGPLIERGTRPHPIDAHGPWSLHNALTGQYFGPHVDHPGTHPQPFIRPAAEAMNGRTVHVR